MSQRQLKSDCEEAFKEGNKQDAERLLPQIGQHAADIRKTTVNLPGVVWYARLVSLLHLAAHHGWMDIVIDLITIKYKSVTPTVRTLVDTLHYTMLPITITWRW